MPEHRAIAEKDGEGDKKEMGHFEGFAENGVQKVKQLQQGTDEYQDEKRFRRGCAEDVAGNSDRAAM